MPLQLLLSALKGHFTPRYTAGRKVRWFHVNYKI